MLDINFIIENKKLVAKAAKDKNIKLDLDKLILINEQRVSLQIEADKLRAKKNEIATLLKDESKRTPKVMEEGKKIKEEIADLEKKEREVAVEFNELMLQVPNIPSKDTPIGKDETANVEVSKVGKPTKFSFEAKNHVELGESLGMLDLERGVKVSGFRGYFLKNEGAQMHLAILQYALNKLISRGFKPYIAPVIVKEQGLINMGQFPTHRAETYELVTGEKEDPKFLAGTAEVALLNQFAGEILDKKDLPIKVAGFSPCYRSEAGSHGKDTKGLYRIHEFMKVEQLILAENDLKASEGLLEELRGISEEILNDLKLPYRVIITSTGDQGQGKYKMYDIETWMPSRDGYGETHSDSLLTDWQARRANIKYKDGKEMKYVHTLNNTAIASPRILIAIWENYQQKDGSIKIPEVLVPYMMGKTLITHEKNV